MKLSVEAGGSSTTRERGCVTVIVWGAFDAVGILALSASAQEV